MSVLFAPLCGGSHDLISTSKRCPRIDHKLVCPRNYTQQNQNHYLGADNCPWMEKKNIFNCTTVLKKVRFAWKGV